MPELGRPLELAANNPYRNVKKYQGPNNNLNQLKKIKSSGEYLNTIAGNKERVGKTAAKVVDGTQQGRLGKDGFLRLLMHQLSHQDPLKPVDQTKMAADLAQFSQLEQMTNMNKNIEKALTDNIVKKKFFAASFLGKKVMAQGASIKHRGENTSSSINFSIPQSAAKGIIQIYDQKRQMISQLDLGARPAGAHRVSWDGKQWDGQDAGKGLYHFQVKTWDELNNEVPVETQTQGLVTGVSFDQYGEPMVMVDGKKIYLRNIQSFQLAQDEKMAHHVNKNNKVVAGQAYGNNQKRDH